MKYFITFCIYMKPRVEASIKITRLNAPINAGEGVEKREPSYTVGGNAN